MDGVRIVVGYRRHNERRRACRRNRSLRANPALLFAANSIEQLSVEIVQWK